MAKKKSVAMAETPVPYVVTKRDMVPIFYVIVEESFQAVRAIYMPIVMPGVSYGVYDTTILNQFLPDGAHPRYSVCDRPLQSVLSELKDALLAHGGSPEAVRIMLSLGQLDEGDIIVAKEKLTSKGAAPKADAKAEKAKGGGKGNTEALAKARAARAEAGPDTRKITILKKENPYRPDSNRAASFDALKGAKTAEDYKTAGGKAKYLSRWADEGIIKLG